MRSWVGHLQQFCGLALLPIALVTQLPAIAQLPLVPDTDPTRSVGSQVVPTGNPQIDRILGGTRPQNGQNLFHSFQEFNIAADRGVLIANPAGVQNILLRVTGGNTSNILGYLGVDGLANLFLLNPAGLLFGPNAQLDVRGSFVATTANALQFGDQGSFSAAPANPVPLLTIQPSALLYQQNQPGAIQLQGATLGVPTGRNLLLVGGDIVSQGSVLFAVDGRIELASLAGTGTIALDLPNQLPQLGRAIGLTRRDMTLTNESVLFVPNQGLGSVILTARNLNLQNGSVVFAGVSGGQRSVGDRPGVVRLDVTDQTTVQQNSTIANVMFGTTGHGGDIEIQTGALAVTSGSALATFHEGIGNGGNVTITAAGPVIFDGQGRFTGVLSLALQGQGNSGDIRIRAQSLTLQGGARLDNSLDRGGNSGQIALDIDQHTEVAGTAQNLVLTSIITSNIGFNGQGQGGPIQITTGSLRVSNAGAIESSVFGQGSGGDITIAARDRVEVDGAVRNQAGISRSGIRSNSFGNSRGQSGTIQIATRDVMVTRGGEIDASTLGQANAGDILINATNTLTIDGEAPDQLVDALGQPFSFRSSIGALVGPAAIGNGGLVQLQTGRLTLSNGGTISTVSGGQGNAATIEVFAQDQLLIQGSARDGNSSTIFSGINQGLGFDGRPFQGVGRGGDIRLTTTDLRLEDRGSIVASSVSEAGIAANIVIRANTIRLADRARIESASATGDGGNIFLNARDYILLRRNSAISTSSGVFGAVGGRGNGGNITLTLPQGFLITAPHENNDITANAFGGSGGNIRIQAQGIYWFTPRDRADLVRQLRTPPFSPARLATNDITASSELGISGTITLNTINVDPSQGLVPLPQNLIETNRLLANSCLVRHPLNPSTFFITGTAGKPEQPGTVVPRFDTGTVRGVAPPPSNQRLPEAQGIYQLPDGQKILSWECR